jgi:hypothetical protein
MMKFKAAGLAVLLLAISSSVAAQSRRFDIRVSFDGNSSRIDRQQASVRVRITNRGRADLKAGGLGEVNFYFSSCMAGDELCRGDDIFYATYSVPSKSIFPDRSFEFEVDLAKLGWKSGYYNRQSSSPLVSLAAVPSKDIYFFADVKILDGFEKNDDTGKKEPRYLEYFSNTINVILD